jgi:hypothetical protein
MNDTKFSGPGGSPESCCVSEGVANGIFSASEGGRIYILAKRPEEVPVRAVESNAHDLNPNSISLWLSKMGNLFFQHLEPIRQSWRRKYGMLPKVYGLH